MGSTTSKTDQPTATVCIVNLPNGTSEADIQGLVSQYGAGQRVQLFSGEPNSNSQDFGYLDLNSDEVENAVAGLDGQMFNGSIIRVSHVSRRPLAPQNSKHPPAEAAPQPDDETPGNLLRRRYKLTSVEKTAMPHGGQGSDWYRYVLSRGHSRITGFHRGTLEEVTAFATSCAEEFNLRSATGKSTRTSAYSKKK